MSVSTGNRVFFIVQGLLKYLAFNWAVALRGWLYRPFFRKFGRGVIIMDNVTIKYPDQIDIGDNTRINEGCYIVGLGGLSIGADVMVGAGAKIVTTSHVARRVDIPMAQQGLAVAAVSIGDDVWVGFDAKILSGTTIGKGSIVGAGAVVTGGSFPDFSTLAGIPARVLQSRIDGGGAPADATSITQLKG